MNHIPLQITWQFLVWLLYLKNGFVDSESACDPTDVFFIVDTATIQADSDGLINLIDSVISSGSNEETGFSVIVWGDNVPDLKYGKNADNDNSILCEIDETTATYHRPIQIEKMNQILVDAFDKVKKSTSGTTVSFEQALDFAKAEAKSDEREHKNQADKEGSGETEDEDVFMVFDYNTVIGQSEGGVKQYIDEFEGNTEQSIHFIIGQKPTIKKIENAKQKKETINDPTKAALRTHFFLFKELVEDIGDETFHSTWDQFLDLTCPVVVIGPDGCKLGLGNHIQYLEADTVRECHLVFDKENGELDPRESYLEVIDELGEKSTATFRIGDTLFASKKVVVKLPKECEDLGVVKVTDRTIIKRDGEANANTLRLKIKDPADISEYITGGKCEGLVDNQVINGDVNPDGSIDTRRRTLSVNPTLTLSWTEEDEWSKEVSYTKYKYKNGAQWSFESSAKVTASYKASFALYVGLYLRIDAGLDWCWYEICWCFWGCCTNIPYPCGFYFEFQVELQAGYGLEFKFNLDFEGWAKLTAPRLLYFQKESIAWIGPVPVKYRPWMEIDLLMETIPVYAEAWIDCEYGHDVSIGYEYKSRGGARGAYVNGPTARRNTCEKGWEVKTGDAGIPRRIGLETTLDGIIGLDFYKCVSGQFIAEFSAPLHLTFTPDECSTWGPCDRTYKPAVLTFEINLQPMWRVVFSASAVADAAKALGASLLSMFGISLGDLDSAPQSLIGHVDKSNANKIGGPINLFTMTPECYDISGIAPVGVLIDHYCGAQNDCAPSSSYSEWITNGNCNPPAGHVETAACHTRGPCNSGYMDKTNGYWYWWYCGLNCAGGTYYTDYGCSCACVYAGDCADAPGYNDFNMYRYIPQLGYLRKIWEGWYLLVLVALNFVAISYYVCYYKRKQMKKTGYKVVSMDSSSDIESVPLNDNKIQ